MSTLISLRSSGPSGTVRSLESEIDTPLQLLALLDEFFRTCTHGKPEDILILHRHQTKKPKDNNDYEDEDEDENEDEDPIHRN